MGQCRVCRKHCESNFLFVDRFFREKFQDIICMWVDTAKNPTECDVCNECESDILEFYSYKQKSREILREKKKRVLFTRDKIDPSEEEAQNEHNPSALQSLLDECDETVEFSVEALEQLNTGVEKALAPKRKKVFSPGKPSKNRNWYSFKVSEKRLAEKLRPKRPLRRKTEAEKAMDPVEYRRYYYKKVMEKYKQTCELCGKRMTADRLEGHMNGHKGLSPFSCEHCALDFNCRLNLRNHIQRMHVTGKEVTCSECGKIATCPRSLKQHMRAVHMEKRFQCSLCGLKILSQHSLQRHMNIHTQTRDYVCTHCGKAFYCKSVLTIHLRTHSGETPYTCDICPKGFVHRRIYVMHMQKLHPDEPLMRLDGAKTLKETLMKKMY